MYEKAKHNTKAGVNAQKGLLEALAIAKKVIHINLLVCLS